MSTTIEVPEDLEEEPPLQTEGSDPRQKGTEPEETPVEAPVVRLAVLTVVALLASSVMAGGIFEGVAPRIYAGIGGALGVLTAVFVRRITRALVVNLCILAALFATGLLVVLPTGVDNVVNISSRVLEAFKEGDVLRPPVDFTVGWRAILVWLMAGIGFAAGWASVELRRPVLGIAIPLPVVAFAAISVPKDAQITSGLISLVLFGIALGILSGTSIDTPGGEGYSLAFELRRGARALPVLAGVSVLVYLLTRFNLLFPHPVFDPTKEAQKPKAVPLSEVPDRVLFTVQSSISGPWRMGMLDVYDGRDWRLPPFGESRLRDIPKSGVIDDDLSPGVKAAFEIRGLDGAVMPGLPNIVGLVAEGDLAYDSRTGNIRQSQGQVERGDKYTVTAARLPSVEELQALNKALPTSVKKFVAIPPAPPAVQELLSRAPTTSAWDRMDFLRQHLLTTVVASGPGTPVSVTPETVQDMLAGSKEGSPFEIVAAQAMLARWAGVPSRIGYGFDGGQKIGEEIYEVRPKNGATFLEVYFPGLKWLPVIGSPSQAKPTLNEDEKQFSVNVVPSNEIALQIYLPTIKRPENLLFHQIRRVFFIVVPILLTLMLLYYTYPAVRKLMLRSKRRTKAVQEGIAARIALAYSEWRDYATDFGYRHESDTPLMFLHRVVEDEEHSAMAWLVTRTLWGDLKGDLDLEDAINAEELGRALRKRLAQSHPWTLRVIAQLSRLSLKYPYGGRGIPAVPVVLRERLRGGSREAA
jgi:hypothetical protein